MWKLVKVTLWIGGALALAWFLGQYGVDLLSHGQL